MSMYVDLLETSLDALPDEDERDRLLEAAHTSRDGLLAHGPTHQPTPYAALVAELSYDRDLVRLCRAYDIAVSVHNFSQPRAARRSLEAQLAKLGVDLVHRPTSDAVMHRAGYPSRV